MSVHEPELRDMDDYNNRESPQKRRLIWLTILGLLAIGAIFATFERATNPIRGVQETLPAQPQR